MSDQIEFLDLMERAEHQRQARRSFIRLCGGAAAMTGGLSLLSACDDDDDVSSDSDDDTGRQQPRGPRHHVERERRNSSEDGLGDLAEAEDLVSRARSGNK